MAILLKERNKNYIPDMVHPLSKGWLKQPNRENIVIDDQYALMSQKDFDTLAEYSTSIPTGVYEGKMWKAHKYELIDDKKVWHWFLCWFGLSNLPGKVSNNMREILLTDI